MANPLPSQKEVPSSDPAVRDAVVGEAYIAAMRVKGGRSAKGVLLISRRRSARIALIDRVCEILNGANVHIVRVRMSKDRSLPALLSSQLRHILQRVSVDGPARTPNDEVLRALAGFAKSLASKYPDIEISIDLEPTPGVADSGVLEFDLTSLFGVIGEAAAQAGTACAILVDDMQLVKEDQLSALIAALHQIAQRKMPVILIGAGSYALRKRVGNAKPYAERMFDYTDLDG